MKTLKLLLFLFVIATFCISCDKTESKQDTPCGKEEKSIDHIAYPDNLTDDIANGVLTYNQIDDSARMYFTWYDKNLCGDSEPQLNWQAEIGDSLNHIGNIYFEVDWYILFQYKKKATNPTYFSGNYSFEGRYTVGLAQMYSGKEGQMYSSVIFMFKSFNNSELDLAFFKRQFRMARILIYYYPFN